MRRNKQQNLSLRGKNITVSGIRNSHNVNHLRYRLRSNCEQTDNNCIDSNSEIKNKRCRYCKCHIIAANRNSRKKMSINVDIPATGEPSTEPLGELDGQLAQMATSVGKKFDFKNMNFKSMLHERWRSMKTWGSFFDTGRWTMPKSALQWSRRLLKNLDHFQSNYFCVVFVLIIYCILTSPLLLIAITATIAAMYMITAKNQESPVKIAGFSPTLYQQYIAVGILSIPLYLLAGAPSLVFWVIGASFFVIGLHASIYAIEMLNTINEDFLITTEPPTSPVQEL